MIPRCRFWYPLSRWSRLLAAQRRSAAEGLTPYDEARGATPKKKEAPPQNRRVASTPSERPLLRRREVIRWKVYSPLRLTLCRRPYFSCYEQHRPDSFLASHKGNFSLIPLPKTKMSGRTFLFARNSPLRTTLIDEATGQAVYQIDTPRKTFSSEVTKIRKLEESSAHAPRNWDDDDAGYDSSEDITGKKGASMETEGGGPEQELPETSDEIARIYWKSTSSDRIIFRGRITTRDEFLPAAGKLKG
jgi:hypothetical protein